MSDIFEQFDRKFDASMKRSTRRVWIIAVLAILVNVIFWGAVVWFLGPYAMRILDAGTRVIENAAEQNPGAE